MQASRFVVHESPQITVWCDPEDGCIHHQIHSYCFGPAFRDALNAGTDALIEHGCTKWLSDDRNNGPLSPDDATWATSQWFPRTRAGGWTHWAMVKPHAVVAQLNVQQFIDLYRTKGVTVEVFTELDKAQRWLDQAKAA